MIPLILASTALLALALLIVIEVVRTRAAQRARTRVRARHPRRQPQIEDQLRSAFEGPRAAYGDIFVSYMVWRRERETRLELFAGDPWMALNAFTRSLVVRHLWRSLEGIAKGSIVIVDSPAQQWSKAIDENFDDSGVLAPWEELVPVAYGRSSGPAFIKEH
jgi:hypothetical protein